MINIQLAHRDIITNGTASILFFSHVPVIINSYPISTLERLTINLCSHSKVISMSRRLVSGAAPIFPLLYSIAFLTQRVLAHICKLVKILNGFGDFTARAIFFSYNDFSQDLNLPNRFALRLGPAGVTSSVWAV